MPTKTNLSPSARAITELIDRISAGNQREFARAVGCAQPVISRIVNGKQDPGRELLERIARVKGVDRTALLATLPSTPRDHNEIESMIPIASCLLDGPPISRHDQLTPSSLAVSPLVCRRSLYAVAAKSCQPAFSDPIERMRADDLVVIDSSLDMLKTNLQILNGKLCVVVVRGPEGNTLTLRRVWVTFDTPSERWTVFTCSDSKVSEFREDKFDGRLLRAIQLDLPESQPDAEYVNQRVDVKDVVGIAVELVRAL